MGREAPNVRPDYPWSHDHGHEISHKPTQVVDFPLIVDGNLARERRVCRFVPLCAA
jgi:hypothetical protein